MLTNIGFAAETKFALPLMYLQVNMLRERNKSYGAIKFVDISSKDYSPQDNQNLDYETVRISCNYRLTCLVMTYIVLSCPRVFLM